MGTIKEITMKKLLFASMLLAGTVAFAATFKLDPSDNEIYEQIDSSAVLAAKKAEKSRLENLISNFQNSITQAQAKINKLNTEISDLEILEASKVP